MQLWDEKKDEGFVMLALAEDSASEVEKIISEYKPNYPIAAGARFNDYGVTGYPTAVLIDHEGRIIWRDHFLDSSARNLLDQALEDAANANPSWDPGERHPALEKAVKAARAGEMGKAWKETEALQSRVAQVPELGPAIEQFQKDFLARSAMRSQRKDVFLADGRYWEATLFYEREIKVYEGSPPAAEWKGWLAEWRKDKDAKANADLDKKRLAALEKARTGDREKAMKELRGLKEKAVGLKVAKAIEETYQKVGLGKV